MPSKYRNEFFDEPRDESLIKLRIYEKYLVPWARKVGSTAKDSSIWVVDGFAGPGSYKDTGETSGSPRLILDHARRELKRGAKYKIGCVFVEEKLGSWQQLNRMCGQYPDVESHPIHGDFWNEIEGISEIVQGQPLLAVIDPFGVKGMDYMKLSRLANASDKCDLIVTFFESAVPRVKPGYPDAITKAIGPETPADKSPAETFVRNLRHETGFLPAGRFPIKQSFDKAETYELIVLSRSVHAYHIWNDLVTRESQKLRKAKTIAQVAGGKRFLGGFSMEDIDASEDLRSAANAILDWSRQSNRGVFRRKDMLDDFVVTRFSSYHTSTLRQAMKVLESAGRLTCEVKRSADTSDWRVIDWTEL